MNNLKVLITKKQIEVYRNLAHILEIIEPIGLQFEGKIINAKLIKAINDLLKDKILGYDKYYVSITKDYSDNKVLNIYCNDRSICINEGNHYGAYYIDCSQCSVKISNERMNSKEFIESIKIGISRMLEYANELEDGLNNIENMERDYQELCKMLELFKSSYPYALRKDLKFYF